MFRLMLTEDACLKGIYTLDPMGAGVRVGDIARALSVARVGAAHTLGRLEKQGLVERFGKNRVGLTNAGRRRAREVKSRYEVIRLYFVEVLGVDGRTAGQEAARLAHSLSDVSFAAMKDAVEHHDDWGALAQLLPA